MGGKKRLFEVELIDTNIRQPNIIMRGKETGYYQMQAVRKFAKKLPVHINLKEGRAGRPDLSRYVFMTGVVKKK